MYMYPITYVTTPFFSQLVRFAGICSDISGFAERMHLLKEYIKFTANYFKKNYEVKLLEKTFNRFLCHHSDTLLKYGPNIQDLLYICSNFKHPCALFSCLKHDGIYKLACILAPI